MVYKLFIDTDVVIDFFTDREPHANDSTQLFELSKLGEVVLYLSAVSVSNIYYIVRKFLGNKKALEVIKALIEMTEIVGTTKVEIIKALSNGFSDFEDSIQYSSALTIKGLDAIITRNIKDYKKSSLAVISPSDFLKLKIKKEG